MPHDEPRMLEEDPQLQRWVSWRNRGRGIDPPLSALAADGRPHTVFVESDLLVSGKDESLSGQLIDRWKSTIVPDPPLPPPPDGWEREGVETVSEFPKLVRHRFSTPPDIDRARLSEALRELGDKVAVSSTLGEGVLGLAVDLAQQGERLGLDAVGSAATLPHTSAQEGVGEVGGDDPYSWGCFTGRSRVAKAWQLVESWKLATSSVDRPLMIGVLDGGFWLDASGRPIVPPGQPESDLGLGVFQLNLLDESVPAGGANPNKCGDSYNCPWHGNGVAVLAAGTVGNQAGAAGTGGTVARPVLFKTDISISQITRCLQVCLAWGVDVLNMSWTLHAWELVFPTSSWNDAFGFAANNGLIMVAAAGNDGNELPDYNVRPATRTPGVTTVGALDQNDQAAGYSNYGSSVDVWAPGNAIPTAPDQDNLNGSLTSGTSDASPIVAGVAAMMKLVNPSLRSVQARQIIHDTGWQGTGRVDRGLDAYAAVSDAMGNRLPADFEEPNDSAATARPLIPTGPGGTMGPGIGGIATLATGSDEDWWVLRVDDFANAVVKVEWYPLLTGMLVDLVPDDPDSRATIDWTSTRCKGELTTGGPLAPGTYRLRVHGNGGTAYRLAATLSPFALTADLFERNDSFERATQMRFDHGRLALVLRVWGPGSYDATLHTTTDRDFFQIDVPKLLPFLRPEFAIANTDRAIDVMLYDAARNLLEQHLGVRSVVVELPRSTQCFVEVAGTAVTRYTIDLRERVNRDALPGPFQEEEVIRLPHWWGDPALRIKDRVLHALVDTQEIHADVETLTFEPAGSLQLDVSLFDSRGDVVRTGSRQDEQHGAVTLDLTGLEVGQHVLRIDRGEQMTAGPLEVRLLPST
jgi:hypothetical protein